ncbi:MAG: site-specific DNA-methyltransferase [Pseudomonadota bacterium]|nr:site-specific DNA-methyltransferase [Pseudomonadota bacterium]
MDKIEPNDEHATSGSIVAENVAALRALFPEAFGEGGIKFDVLKQLLGGPLDDGEERYGLSWHGKKRARQIALTPSLGTLRPCPDESVDWETTNNIVIEGDNLEVLKLLRKSYAGKVKLIYIDPPYNTGKDFVYPDDFADGVGNYLRITGQVGDDGGKITSNTESSGRFHTNWLNMMYPRLKVAKELLSEDGAIFISIDDTEIRDLKAVCDEVFGESNFVVPVIWQKRVTPENRRAFSVEHDYVLCYARSAEVFGETRRLLPLTDEARDRYRNPDKDPRGDWLSVPAIAQGGHGTKSQFYQLLTPDGRLLDPPPGCCWRYNQERMTREIADNRIWFGASGGGVPRIKKFLDETRQGITPSTLWFAEEVGANEDAKKEVSRLLDGAVVFDNPKPTGLLRRMQDITTEAGTKDIILDFFAGSGTAGHAVMAQNAADNGTRRYICVQLPEPLDPENKDQKPAADFCDKLGKPRTIAELTKERLRRAGKKIKAENKLFRGDTGFRVFKLDSSNLKPWDPRPDDLPNAVTDWIENIRPGRTEQDLLYELLLKLGLDLCVPVEVRTIAGKAVYNIGAGTLIVCLDKSITRADAEPLGLGLVQWAKQLAPAGGTQFVFRDSAFADDVAKTNLDAILRQNLPDDALAAVRSL